MKNSRYVVAYDKGFDKMVRSMHRTYNAAATIASKLNNAGTWHYVRNYFIIDLHSNQWEVIDMMGRKVIRPVIHHTI